MGILVRIPPQREPERCHGWSTKARLCACLSSPPPGEGPGSGLSVTPEGALGLPCITSFFPSGGMSIPELLPGLCPFVALPGHLTALCLLPSHCWHLLSTNSLPLPALSLTLVGTCQVTCPRRYGDNWDGVSLAVLFPMPGSVPGV